jgi:hypothetical protein
MTFASRRKWAGRFLLSVMSLTGDCHASPPCAETIGDLRALLADPSFPLKWYETTMDDDKPLVLSILERNGSLSLEFVKTGEGLWAESACAVCMKGEDLEARFGAEQVRLGPSAGWATRYTFANGGQFTLTRLDAEQLRIATTGWSGTFSSREKKK